ncbi:hypothetical protein SDC9_182134 [bioreactor metagenome]|uniref:Uncharacterized protein n=1 Tax=bioreactor metagenome TaxID=1076179 RepID=A0A645H7I1_9ZZZZ
MYDYMKTLQKSFVAPPECERIRHELERAHEALHEQLDKQQRTLLLRYIDLENALREETSLCSFLNGYRLACGIYRELLQEPPHSFEQEEETTAEALYLAEKQAAAAAKED